MKIPKRKFHDSRLCKLVGTIPHRVGVAAGPAMVGALDDRLSGWECPEGSVCVAEGAEGDHYCRFCRTRREYRELGVQFPS